MSGATHVHERRDDELVDLWESFKTTGDERAREGLILHFSPLVKFVAGRLGSGLPRNVDPSDLVSYGTFGLIDAIDKFEPERGWSWSILHLLVVPGEAARRIGRLPLMGRAAAFAAAGTRARIRGRRRRRRG